MRAANPRSMRVFCASVFLVALASAGGAVAAVSNARPGAWDVQMPRYAHVFVIVEENKNYRQIVGSGDAPFLNALAREYGNATHFYAETHPSEPNYVALVGGYTYGIRDDDAFYCRPHDTDPSCPHSNERGYVDHTIDAPSLASQLQAAGLTWKNYNESIPAAGSLAIVAADRHGHDVPPSLAVYASKHSGFINFLSVQRDPQRARHMVGFDRLYADLRSGRVPNFSLVIPNICDEMHGAGTTQTPQDCNYNRLGKLIRRGDENAATLIRRIMVSSVWRSRENAAIVITFDENDDWAFVGCCGNDPRDLANRGGGHIPTIVVTNHGRRHVADATPYSHYSLLRTIEDAFGIHTYLHRAAAPGVVPMLPLFRTASGR